MNKLKEITPITKRIPADRQGAKRHYGVHPYFTRRPYNVVRDYVRHYSQSGDVVMDPFGGSGVTAIEAFIDGRVGIQNDINPLANFIASGIAALAGGEIPSYLNGLLEIEQAERTNVQALATMSDDDVNRLLATLPLPANVRLPRSADVEYYRELFTERQLAALAILKRAIDRISDARVRNAMLLAWSATLSKLNKTFISARFSFK